MTDTALKPCPMCGSSKVDGCFIRDGWRIGCLECGTGVQAYHPSAHSRAAEKWNTRAALSAQPTQLPQDVINLVIAAREVAYEDFDPEKMKALDKAVEAFGECVSWDNEPEGYAGTVADMLELPVPTPPGEPQLVEHENGVNISLQHASDCALHNAPALPVGPCNCHLSKSRNEAVIPFQPHSCTSLPVTEGDKALAHPHPVETVQADVQPVAIEQFKRTSIRRMTTGGNYVNLTADVVLFTDHQATVAALKAEHLRRESELVRLLDRADESRLSQIRRAETADLSLAECQREKEGLREALRPLVQIAEWYGDVFPDHTAVAWTDLNIRTFHGYKGKPTVVLKLADCRRAQTALNSEGA